MNKILVVDDDRHTCQLVRKLLSGDGVSVGFLLKPRFLFERLASELFDLLLFDINMPGITGIELLREVKANPRYADLPVIMLTGDEREQTLSRCFESGAVDFIQKPIKPLVLQARVRAALAMREEQVCSRWLLRNIYSVPVARERVPVEDTPLRFHSAVSVACLTTGEEGVGQPLEVALPAIEDILAEYNLVRLPASDGLCYASGLRDDSAAHAVDAVLAALQIRRLLDVTPRIAIHSGPALSRVTGNRPHVHELWGDTVEAARHMVATVRPGEILASQQTHKLISDFFDCELRDDSGHDLDGPGLYEVHGIQPGLHDSRDHYHPNDHFRQEYARLGTAPLAASAS